MLKFKKRFFLLFVIVGLLATLASCASSNKYVKLTLDKDCYEIYKGQTLNVEPLINKGSSVGEVVVEYSSHDDSIATYTNGKLHGVEYGTTIIKVVYANNVTICDVATVKVVEHDVEGSIEVNETPVTLYETDAPYTISHTSYAEVEYVFESSNKEVATVDEFGVVTPALDGAKHNDGKATITVTAKDVYGATADVVYTVEVTVVEAHYSITLDLAGGEFEGEYATEYDVNELPHVLPTPTRPGYTFAGWVDADDEVFAQIPAETVGAVSYTAKWVEKTYTITYDLAGGALKEDETNPASYKADEVVTLVAPTKKGHTFAGWSIDGKKFETFPSDSYKDVVVKAEWTANKYDIEYVSEGHPITKNPNPAQFEYGKGLTLETPVINGYTFVAWYSDAECTTPITVIAADCDKNVTVYAKWLKATYQATLVCDGGTLEDGTTPENIQFTITDDTKPLPVLVKKGYTFKGWFDAAGTKYTEIVTGSYNNITLTAKWEANKYNITYVSTPAITVLENEKQFEYGKGYTLQTPVVQGYAFKGWFTDAEFKNPISVIAPDCDKDVTVYAKWDTVEYTVKLNALGGTYADEKEVKDLKYTIKSDTIVLQALVKKGHTFKGWFDAEDNQVIAILSGSHDDMELTAKWEVNKYNITYVLDGGENAEANVSQYTYNVAFVFANPTKKGYTFVGWFKDAEFKTAFGSVPAGTAEDVVVYAKWEINQYTISFNSNGGTAVTAITQDYATAVTAPTAPTKTGHTFAGWYNGDDAYTFTTMPDANIVLTAKWTPDTYTITYVSKDTPWTTNDNATTYSYGVAYVLKDAKKNGYKFLGWYKEEACTNKITEIAAGNTGDVTVYAKWEVVEYTAVLNANGGKYADGSTPANIKFTVNDGNKPLNALVKSGYTFAGWYKDAEFKTPYGSVIPAGTSENLVLYAKFEANSYSIVYVLNGGVNPTTAATTYKFNTAYTLPTPEKTGYTFLGWYKDAEFKAAYGTVITAGTTETVTVYANWQINKYTISFNCDGGTPVAPIAQDYATAVTTPTAPTKTGYTFAGWYNGDVAYTFTTMPAENITLKAKWNINAYTITFDADGGSYVAPISQNYATAVTAPTAPTKTGYTFVGWFKGDAAYTFTTMPAENITVKAKWAVNSYTITFDSKGGTTVAPITQNFNTDVTAPTNPTKAAYDFVRWVDKDNNPYTFAKMPAENITLYAVWTAHEYKIEYVGVPTTVANANPTKYTIESEDVVLATLTAEHFEFKGWFQDPACTVAFEKIAKGTAGDIKVYSKWVAKVYEIVYNPVKTGLVEFKDTTLVKKDAETGKLYTEYTNDEEVLLPTPVLAGYEFKGWFDNASLTGEAVTKVEKGSFGTLNFYAKWEARTYTIEFVVTPVAGVVTAEGQMYEIEGLKAPTATTYTIEDEEKVFATLTAEGYEFVGWAFAHEGSYVLLADGKFLPATQHGNFKFYALWKVAAAPAE